MSFRKKSTSIGVFSRKLANARKKNTLIKPIPVDICKNLSLVKKIRVLAEKRLDWHPIGFKIGATNKKISKILNAKEPFYSYLYKERTFKNNSKLKLEKNTLGIELEIAYKLSKKIFKKKINNKKEIIKFVYGISPALELVGFRQNLKKLRFVGQAAIDFGLNSSFVKSKVYKINDILNFKSKTQLINLKNKKVYLGHTNKVMGNPINSLFWLIKELQETKVTFNKDFWVTTGTTTSIIPVKKGDIFKGEVKSVGNICAKF